MVLQCGRVNLPFVKIVTGFMPIAESSIQGDGYVYSTAVFLEALSWLQRDG
jgi:hypothetical protein